MRQQQQIAAKPAQLAAQKNRKTQLLGHTNTKSTIKNVSIMVACPLLHAVHK